MFNCSLPRCNTPRGAHAASVFALNAGAVSFGQIVKAGKFAPRNVRDKGMANESLQLIPSLILNEQ